MDSALLSFQHGGFKVLPTLYTDIANIILSFVHASEEYEDLLNFALVCREWCQLTRRLSFAKLDDLTPSNLSTFRELFKSGSGPSDGASNETTFAKHVRRAILYINLDDDDWTEVKEIIVLMNRSFTTRFKLTVMLRCGVLQSSHLLDLKACCGSITHLGLISVQLDMPKGTLSDILCDHSWPSLTDLTLERTTWFDDNSSPALRDENETSTRTLTLDHLHFLEGQCDRNAERFFPNLCFEVLIVKSLILRVDVLSSSFWEGVPDMLRKISANVVEIDAAHEMNYPDFTRDIKGIRFPKLQTLQLRIMQHAGYSAGGVIFLGDNESALRTLLREMDIPALQTLVISIADAGNYIVPDDRVADFNKQGRFLGRSLGWDVVDEAVSQLIHPSEKGLESQTLGANGQPIMVEGRHSGPSKVVVAAWFEDALNHTDNDSVIRYLKRKFPLCTSQGVEVDFAILNYIDFD